MMLIYHLPILHQQLVETAGKLSTANANLVTFFSKKKIPYNGSTQKLEQLLSFTDLVLDAPEEHFHLQTPGLTRDGAVQALDQLLSLQGEWTRLEKELGDSLYVDTLPHEGDIKQAILTLRGQGVVVVLVEQRVDAVLKLADRVAFMVAGRVAETREVNGMAADDPAFLSFVGV